VIRHVVMWELHERERAPWFAQRLRECAGIVPGMLGFEVGLRDPALAGTVDVCLLSTFADAQALRAYEEHPVHREVSARLAPLRKSRHVLDYVSGEGDQQQCSGEVGQQCAAGRVGELARLGDEAIYDAVPFQCGIVGACTAAPPAPPGGTGRKTRARRNERSEGSRR